MKTSCTPWISRFQNPINCLSVFFFFFKSVYILQLIGEKILIHYFTTWIFLMLRNVIEILMRSQSALADSPLSLLLLYLKNKKNNPIVSCCTIEANSFIHSFNNCLLHTYYVPAFIIKENIQLVYVHKIYNLVGES